MRNLQLEQDAELETVVLKPSPDNKDVIQSYILTTARYDFSVYEKRILYRIVECFQFQIAGQELDNKFLINERLNGDVEVVMPISSLLLNVEDEHYARIKKAFLSLERKRFVYEDNKVLEVIRLIERLKINKYSRIIRFRLHQEVHKALLDFSKGFRKYELNTTMSFRSVYSMCFYEPLSGQKKPLTYSIEDLKAMFRLEKNTRM